MPEKLEIRAEEEAEEEIGEKTGGEVEVLHDFCEVIGFCYQYSHSVSNKVRWNNCHTTNHLDCDYRSLLRKLGAL